MPFVFDEAQITETTTTITRARLMDFRVDMGHGAEPTHINIYVTIELGEIVSGSFVPHGTQAHSWLGLKSLPPLLTQLTTGNQSFAAELEEGIFNQLESLGLIASGVVT